MTSSVDEGKAENVVYLAFSKVFHVVSHRILVSDFRWSSLDRQKTDWIAGQKALMLCPEAGYSGVPWGSVLSDIFINDLEEETGCSTIRSAE